MAVPSFHQSVYEQGLDRLAEATAVHACTSEPANHAGIAAVSVGSYALESEDWTIQVNLDDESNPDGWKATLSAQSGNNATGTGAGNVLAYTDGTTLLGVTAGSGATLNDGSPWTIGSYDVLTLRAATEPD